MKIDFDLSGIFNKGRFRPGVKVFVRDEDTQELIPGMMIDGTAVFDRNIKQGSLIYSGESYGN